MIVADRLVVHVRLVLRGDDDLVQVHRPPLSYSTVTCDLPSGRR